MAELAYERPTRIEDAVALMSGDGARALAGGTDLIAQVREGRRSMRIAVDLKRVPELTSIVRNPDGGWTVGAAASVARLGANADLIGDHGALVASAQLIGSLQIQSRASIGGNLANGAPSADAVPLLVSLGAQAVVAGGSGRRTVSVESLLAGPGRTAIQPGEILVALLLPPPRERSGACYLRFTPRREMDIAIAGAGVAIDLDQAGTIKNARITLASVAPTALRAHKAEALLAGARPEAGLLADAGRTAAAEASPISDTRGTADYRRDLVAVLVKRALQSAIAKAQSLEGRP